MTGIVDRPRYVVEGCFGTDDGGNRLWSDLTGYLELDATALDINQRRQNIFDRPGSGTISFALDNRGGEFTRENSSSPFYPAVTQNTPLRARVQYPTTVNLLSGPQSRTDDTNAWTAPQGGLDVTEDSPASGVTSSVVWETGVLQQTGARVATGRGPWTMPGDKPVYVKAGRTYSARLALRASGSISVSLRLGWYDVNGTYLSEETSATTALTSGWQTLTVSGTAPEDGALRLSVANETTVLPTTATIDYHGGQDYVWVSIEHAALTVPDTAQAGDLAVIFVRQSRADTDTPTMTTGTGWTLVGGWADAMGKTWIWQKIIEADEIGTTIRPSWSHSQMCRVYGSMIVYGGVHQTSPLDVTPTEATETVVRTTHTTPNITTTHANCLIVSAVFDVSTTTTTWGAPGGEQVRQYGFGTRGNASTGIVTDNGSQVAAGTYGSKTFTASKPSKYATMHTLALRPATGTGPGSVTVYLGAPMAVEGSLPAFTEAGDWDTWITAYADSWDQSWYGGATEDTGRVIVEVQGTDRSKKLASSKVRAAIHEAMSDADPIALYVLDEGNGATEAADSSEASQPTLAPLSYGSGAGANGEDAIKWGEGTGPGVDGTAALILNPADASNGQALSGLLDTPLGDCPAISAAMCIASPGNPTGEGTPLKVTPETNSTYSRSQFEFYGCEVGSQYAGVKMRIVSDSTTLDVYVTDSTDYLDGTTHVWGATCQITGGQLILKFYMDGELRGTSTAATDRTYLPPMNSVTIGNAYRTNGRMFPGTYSNLALYNALLGDDDMDALSTAALTAYAGDTVPDRITRLMNWKDLTGTDLDRSAIEVDRHPADETDLLAALDLVANTDGGVIYIDGDDKIAFRSANTKQATTSPVLTIAAGDLATSPTSGLDDAILINDVTVTRKGAGTSQRLTDRTSIDAHNVHDKTFDTLLTSDAEARERAGYYLAFYAEPYTRFDEIAVEALLLDDMTDLLAAKMWQIIRVTGLPETAPASQLDSHVEGRQITLGPDSWLFAFDVSYAIPFAVTGTRDTFGQVVVAL